MKQDYSIRKNIKNYTLKDIKEEIDEDALILADLGYGAVLKNHYECEFNNRALNRLGRCTCIGRNRYRISINEQFLKLANPENVHNTIMHEVIHSLPGCMNHGKEWQNAAKKVNANYNFTPITRLHDLAEDKHYENYVKSNYHYSIECEKCHTKWNYMKKTKTYSACKEGRARCSCGSRIFICKEL